MEKGEGVFIIGQLLYILRNCYLHPTSLLRNFDRISDLNNDMKLYIRTSKAYVNFVGWTLIPQHCKYVISLRID